MKIYKRPEGSGNEYPYAVVPDDKDHGIGQYIDTTDDLIHEVKAGLPDVTGMEEVTVPLRDWVHYFGIKGRVRGNYAIFRKSCLEVGIDVRGFPEWGPKQNAGG